MNLHQALLYAEDLLSKNGIEQPRWDAERLLIHALKQDRAHLYANLSRELTPEEFQSFDDYIRKRAEHYPLAYMEGVQEFFGRTFSVDENVLIPRPETEEIIHAVLALPLPARPRILDLGAGSGNVTVTLSLEIPDAHAFALEFSPGAIEVLQRNSDGKVKIVRGNFDFPPFHSDAFHVITTNPPYVEASTWDSLPRETQWEPRAALITMDLEKTYAALIDVSTRLLKPNGYLVFEIGFGQSDRIRAVCERQSALRLLQIRKDQLGIPRTFVLQKSSKMSSHDAEHRSYS